jgi:hypothetical protein
MGLLQWMRRGNSGRAAGSVLAVFDEIYSPSAHRARELLDQQHERVIPTPSPGDRMLDEGIIEIRGAHEEPEP